MLRIFRFFGIQDTVDEKLTNLQVEIDDLNKKYSELQNDIFILNQNIKKIHEIQSRLLEYLEKQSLKKFSSLSHISVNTS